MNLRDEEEEEDMYRFDTPLQPSTTSRNMSSSSSAFYSANQSPFFSPRSPTSSQIADTTTTRSEANNNVVNLQRFDRISSSTGVSNTTVSSHNNNRERLVRPRNYAPVSLSSNRIRSCDVFIGLHGRKPSLLRFVNWLRAELEAQGMSCFVSDRARLRNSHKHGIVEKAMDVSSFGVVIVTAKSFKNPYSVEELRLFSGKKNLVPIFFDLGAQDCLVRDIVEKRGDLWEKNGGELWISYGGIEKEWIEAIRGLSRVDEWKLEARDGQWRDCISKAVTLLATKLGRRSVVDRVAKWKEKAEREEFPFPRNEAFIGRKKELSELEFILFGDVVSGDSERDYFELKARPRRKVSVSTIEDYRSRRRKGKDPVVWKESEKEIEMQQQEKSGGAAEVAVHPRHPRRKRSSKILYGKGIACVSGEPGIGKTELLLEFAYRHHQRYKMVLWVGGESRYIRQNYLNLWPFLEVDVGLESCPERGTRVKNFEEQEESAVSRVRRELMRNIPFLVVIDNLDGEKDWWDHKPVMDLLPRFGGETHILVSTRLPRALNLEPLRLSYLSGVEATSLMTMAGSGSARQYPIAELDALRAIEDRLGRSTIGLAIVGAILSELPITPSRLLETANRMSPAKDDTWRGPRQRNTGLNWFLNQLFEVCFSIFDHADGRPRSLATRMIHASGWFAPAPIPVALLAQAANRIPEKDPQGLNNKPAWRALLRSLTCGLVPPRYYSAGGRSESEAVSMLMRFGLARAGTRPGCVHVGELVRLYARRRAVPGAAQAVVQAVVGRGGPAPAHHHPDHVWAACFLLFGFGRDPVAVEARVPDLLHVVREVAVPLAVRTFVTFSRCAAALELLRLCTNALEAAEQAFVTPVEKWAGGDGGPAVCWWVRPVRTGAQLNPCLWQELALARAMVLETRAKLMIRGGQFDVADDLIRKTVFIRTSVSGEDHPDTAAARETLGKITRLLANLHVHS